MGVLVGGDVEDAATEAAEGYGYPDYTQFLDVDGLRGARIGVRRGDRRPGPDGREDRVERKGRAGCGPGRF